MRANRAFDCGPERSAHESEWQELDVGLGDSYPGGSQYSTHAGEGLERDLGEPGVLGSLGSDSASADTHLCRLWMSWKRGRKIQAHTQFLCSLDPQNKRET
ncbi:hypothetical protein FRC08_018464 [Ceratobasidium sp. 394]|nr:hypothetical protein FRC08_018464 [Ceratobasidium sp. 394]